MKNKNSVRSAFVFTLNGVDNSNRSRFALIFFLIFIVLAVLSPLIDLPIVNSNIVEPFFTIDNFLGTDIFGRDLFKLSIKGYGYTYGNALLITICNLVISLLLAILVNVKLLHRLKSIMIFILEPIYSFPSIISFFILISLFSDSYIFLFLSILISTIPYSFFSLVSFIEKIRNSKESEFIKLDGASEYYIVKNKILPKAVPRIIHLFRRVLVIAIIDLMSIGFIGLVYNEKTPDWGVLLRLSLKYYVETPWMMFILCFFIILSISITVYLLRRVEVEFDKYLNH